MQNTIHTLEDLFRINSFRIPQYQRAYAWETAQLEVFLEDLRQQRDTQEKNPTKQYYLGTFLLHEEDVGKGKKVINVVDGQQRMTTAVIFFSAALALHKTDVFSMADERWDKKAQRIFIYDEDDFGVKFHTIQEDDPFFQAEVLGISGATGVQQDSASSKRLKDALEFFKAHVKPQEWRSLVPVLQNASVMVYAVQDPGTAVQIFELQNDRGRPLTSLEALKSFLMHCIYQHSIHGAEDRLASLQTQFAKIFRVIEGIAERRDAPDEDQVLAYHCAAFLPWGEKEYNNPKRLVKSVVKKMGDGAAVIAWVENFVDSLLNSYKSIEQMFVQRDGLDAFSELVVLGRMGNFWPLVLASWQRDKTTDKREFQKVCRLLEVFAFRGYAMVELRSNTNQSTLFTLARDFSGEFEPLFQHLASMSFQHNLEARFAAELEAPYFYDQSRDALYLLWRYENHLRQQRGQKQPLISWRDFVDPANNGAKLSIEHIMARSNPASGTTVCWDAGKPLPFHEIALNRLGNLVLDSSSPNSSKGCKDFSEKLKKMCESSVYVSQGELPRFIGDASKEWTIDAIKARHAHLLEFSKKIWHPRTWHPSSV